MKSLPFVLLIGGLVFSGFGGWLILSAEAFVKNSNPSRVRVVAIDEQLDEDGRLFRPTFAVELEDGSKVNFKGNTWVSARLHEVGDVVPGRYAPNTGEIRSLDLIDYTKNSGRQFFLLGGVLYC